MARDPGKLPTVLSACRDLFLHWMRRAENCAETVRVGFVGNTPEPSGGAEIFLENLIVHLHGRAEVVALARWQRQVLVYGNERCERVYKDRETIETDERTGVETYYLFQTYADRNKRRWQTISSGIKLAGFFLRERVSVIHCHLLYPNIYFAYLAARLLGVPLIVTIHGVVDLAPLESTKFRRRALLHTLRHCDRVVAVSDEIRQRCLELSITRVEVRGCGIDTEFFTPEQTPERGILFIGNLTEAKGFDRLIDAYREIRRVVDEPLLLAGKNPAELRFDAEEGVEYLGLLEPEALRDAIRRCKLVVFPSRTEGLPLTVIEAMSCNKLVLAAPVGDVGKLVVDSQNGFLLSATHDDLSERIVAILDDYAAWKIKIGSNPRNRARRFDIRTVAEWHRELYRNRLFARRLSASAEDRGAVSLKRRFVLPALVRACENRSFDAIARRLYVWLSRLIGWLVSGNGVQGVYLRRGMAKQEFMPFFSDIDLTVVVEGDEARARLQRRVKRLTKLVPMMEEQTPVLTVEEFKSWTARRNFAEHRAVWYRLVEAKQTWLPIHSVDRGRLLDEIRELGRAETILCVESEIQFWNAILNREYSDYHLRHRCPRSAFVLKRSAWTFLKATTELWNFAAVYRNHRKLRFSRREILESAAKSGPWAGFFSDGLRLLENEMHLDEMPRYLNRAHAFLSDVYREFHRTLLRILDEDPELIRDLEHLRSETAPLPKAEYYSIRLDGLEDVSPDCSESIIAVCVTSMPIGFASEKLALVFIVESLDDLPLTDIERIRRVVLGQLRSAGVSVSDLRVDLVDVHCYLSFGAVPTLAKDARFLLDRKGLNELSLGPRFRRASRPGGDPEPEPLRLRVV